MNAVDAKPVMAVLLAYEGDAARAWAALPWSKCVVDDDGELARIVVQRVSQDLTAVVLHSTHAFGEAHKDVYGATSTASRVGGAKTDSTKEADLVDALLAAASRRLAPEWLELADVARPCYGPHLHRWGNAFPTGPPLDARDATVPTAGVVFLGDYVKTGREGTFEGAVLSGLYAAEELRFAAVVHIATQNAGAPDPS